MRFLQKMLQKILRWIVGTAVYQLEPHLLHPQMWVGIEKSCTYAKLCQHSLMASNGGFSLQQDWFDMQKQSCSAMQFLSVYFRS